MLKKLAKQNINNIWKENKKQLFDLLIEKMEQENLIDTSKLKKLKQNNRINKEIEK
ncbi:hypothetical protein JPM7_0670 [Metamycoplasma equirhinis]|uniref:hypothetical protein n=1 Tax=Metamycoplasma equirhinis TaxID=92402 RepID=UPI002572F7CC|nr:hypothetical protein [Metamycoplasma equirhinis]BDX52460.1 hypothetical protein JPM7_0670 [Metamycoplasma equirhinis]